MSPPLLVGKPDDDDDDDDGNDDGDDDDDDDDDNHHDNSSGTLKAPSHQLAPTVLPEQQQQISKLSVDVAKDLKGIRVKV